MGIKVWRGEEEDEKEARRDYMMEKGTSRHRVGPSPVHK